MPFSGLGSGSNLGGFDIAGYIGIVGLSKFNQDLNKATTNADKAAKAMNRGLNVAIAAGAAAFALAIKSAADFEAKMGNIHTLLGPGEEAQRNIESMGDAIVEMSTKFPASAQSLSEAMYQIVSATVPPAEAMGVLEESVKGAVAGVASTEETFNLFSATVKGYGMEWAEVGRISDIVFQTIKLGQTTMGELATSMQGAIPLASTLGIKFEEIAGATATLTGVTGSTSEVMTQIESIMTALIKQSTGMKGAFEALGVSSGQELISKFEGLQGALGALKGYTDEYNLSIGKVLGRKEALVAYYALTGAQAQNFADKTKAMFNAVGAAQDAYLIKMDEFGNQATLLKNTVSAAFIELGNKMLPALTAFFSALNSNSGAIMAFVKSLAEVAMGLGAIAAGYKIVGFIKALPALWAAVTAALGPVGVAILAITAAYIALKTAIGYVNGKLDEAHKARLLAIDSMSTELEKVKALETRYNDLKDKESLTKDEQKELDTVTKNLYEKYRELGTHVSTTDRSFGDLLDHLTSQKMKEANAAIDEAGTKIGVMAGLMAQGGAVGALAGVVDGLFHVTKRAGEQIEMANQEIAELNAVSESAEGSVDGLGGELSEADKAALAAAEAHKRLTEAGIETTAEIKNQIAAWEALKADAGSDQFALKQIESKIKDLNDKLGTMPSISEAFGEIDTGGVVSAVDELTPRFKSLSDVANDMYWNVRSANPEFEEFANKQEALKAAYDTIRNPQQIQIDQWKALLDSGELLPGEVLAIEEALDKTEGTTEKGNKEWASYLGYMNDLINRMPGVSDQFKGFATLATTALTQLLSGGLDPVSLGFSALNLIIGDFTREHPPFRRSVEEISDIFEKWGTNIEDVKLTLDELTEKIQSSTLEALKEKFAELEETIATTNSNIANLGTMMQANYETFVAQLQFENLTFAFTFTANYEDVTEGIEFLSSERKRMQDLFGDSFNFSGFDQLLMDQIEASKQLLNTLDPTSEAYRLLSEQINNAELALEGIYPEVISFNDAIVESIDYVNAMSAGVSQLTAAFLGDIHKYFAEFYKFNNDGIALIESLEEAIYFGIDPQDAPLLSKQIEKLIADWEAYIETLDPNSQAYADALAGLDDLRDKFENWLNPAVEDAIDSGEDLVDTYGNVGDAIDTLGDSNDVGGVFDALADKMALFKEYGIQTRGELIEQIREMERLVGYLREGTDDYNKFTYELGLLYEQLGVTNPYLGEAAHLQYQLANAGIETTDSVQAQIDQYEALLPLLEEGSYEYQQVIDKLGPLYDKLGLVNPYLHEQAEGFLAVEDGITKLNIQLDDYLGIMFGQFDEMMKMLGSFGEEGFEANGELFQLLDRLQNFNIDFEDTNVDEQILMWIARMEEYLATLDPDSQAWKDATWALAELKLRFEEMGGSMDDLPDDWRDQFDFGDEDVAPWGKLDETMGKLNDTIALLVETLGGIPDELEDANDELDKTKDKMALIVDEALKMPNFGDPGPFDPPPTKHLGGMITTAHTGLYNHGDETLIKALRGEMVIQRPVVDKYGAQAMIEFNRTGDASKLMPPAPSVKPVEVHVHAHEATPETWFEVTQKQVYPNIRQSQRYYETGVNPYNGKRS